MGLLCCPADQSSTSIEDKFTFVNVPAECFGALLSISLLEQFILSLRKCQKYPYFQLALASSTQNTLLQFKISVLPLQGAEQRRQGAQAALIGPGGADRLRQLQVCRGRD